MTVPDTRLIIGIDVGGTKTAVIAGTVDGTILWRRQFPTNASRGFEVIFRDLCTLVDACVREFPGRASALSVAIGGPLDIARGIVKSPPNLPGWSDIPLKALLAERYSLPAYVEQDGNAGALAELYFGAGKGLQNIVFLTMGTGFGAGLILDGRLYRGTNDIAGEIGHIRVADTGPDCYGKPGSLEGFCSGSGLAMLARLMFPGTWRGNCLASDVYRAYRAGSDQARAVFAVAAKNLGRGLAMLADLLNPQRIILGGIGMRFFDALVEPSKLEFAREALPLAQEVCEIVPAGLGESIGDVAALSAALQQGGVVRIGSSTVAAP